MYLVDSDVFIEAKNRHYGFDFCPAFWDWLDTANRVGRVYSVDRVREELEAGSDELADWARQRPAFFLRPDADVAESLAATSGWLSTSRYEAGARSTFADSADYFLVAHAHAKSFTVVTHEQPSTGRRVKIPNACDGMRVRWIEPWALLRAEGARFVLP